ncbi:small nucleolar RNA host (non-protein coding) [Cricetulus griseus]|nr:small nucleolar RNA host (non-protein coding) [Cricetulus griseus]
MTKLVCGSQRPSPRLSALCGGRYCPGSRSPELTPWCRGAMRDIYPARKQPDHSAPMVSPESSMILLAVVG